MATVGVQAQPAMPKAPNFKPIIENVAAKSKTFQEFDPKKHIQFKEPSEIIMMKDIGYPEDAGVSKVAVSQPFQSFTPEAIQHMRDEVSRPEVMENCKYSSNIAACQLRGYAPKYAPFIYDAWNNPETLAIISKIAGVDSVPQFDFEIGHVNVSVKSEKEAQSELAMIEKEKQAYANDEGIAGCPWEDDKPVVGWHTDSYPFVCVLMLSDCSTMVGGETASRTGNGEVIKVRGPQMGCAVVLQGRYITHEALRALGAQERISMVTSFRPKSPHLPDDTESRTVRPISDLSRLYFQFGDYRLAMSEERSRSQSKVLRTMQSAGKKFDTKGFKKFLSEQEHFLKRTNEEIVPDEEVQVGYIDEVDIPDVGCEDTEETMRIAKRAREA